MTRKDLRRWYENCEHFKRGYCCQYAATNRLKEIGYNSGVYGWNWTLYYESKTDTLYCSYYRNVPDYLIEK